MKSNVIILTTGSSGSSVLAGLIATQGYWLGDDTKKLNFDTFENAELVDLNIKLLAASGFKRNDCNDLPPPSIKTIKKLVNRVDLKPFRNFIEKCNTNRPWLWKDPRLSFTIHFWEQLIKIKSTHFIFIDRNPIQSYAGLILSRRIPMSCEEQSKINKNYQRSCSIFFEKNTISYLHCTFEDMILYPKDFIAKLNRYIGSSIAVNDLEGIYRGELYRLRYSKLSFIISKLYYWAHRHIIRDHITFPRN